MVRDYCNSSQCSIWPSPVPSPARSAGHRSRADRCDFNRMADDGARLAMQSNHDTPEVTWASDAAGTSVTAPGRHGEVTFATLAAPKKGFPRRFVGDVDSTADADTSASTISSSLQASIWEPKVASRRRFVDQHRRGLLTAGELYDLRVSHAWSHTGTFPITLKLSDGRVLVTRWRFATEPRHNPPAPSGPRDKPTVSFPPASSAHSRLGVSFTHLTPNTWVTSSSTARRSARCTRTPAVRAPRTSPSPIRPPAERTRCASPDPTDVS